MIFRSIHKIKLSYGKLQNPTKPLQNAHWVLYSFCTCCASSLNGRDAPSTQVVVCSNRPSISFGSPGFHHRNTWLSKSGTEQT